MSHPKLRILRERKESAESSETDLRGLGNEAIFKHFHPTAVLSRKGPVPDTLKQILQDQGIRTQSSSHPGVTHFVVIGAQAGSHKVDAVKLYSCVLAFSSHTNIGDGKFALWEQRPFQTLMKNAIQGNHLQEAPQIDDHFWISHFHGKQFFQVMTPVAKYLFEAGFEGFKNALETVAISHDEVKTRLQKEIEQIVTEEAETSIRKTG